MAPTEDTDVVLARLDQRTLALERDVRDIKTSIAQRTPPWPSVVAAFAAVAALVVTLISII